MNILIGGRLGDAIMYLSMCKYISRKLNTKCNVFLDDDDFRQKPEHRSCIYTYNSLKNIVINQKYINNFQLYKKGHPINLDLTRFRKFRDIRKWMEQLITWPELYRKLYFDELKNEVISPGKNSVKIFDKATELKTEYYFKDLLDGKRNTERFSESWIKPTQIYKKYKDALIISRCNYRPKPDEFIINKYYQIIKNHTEQYGKKEVYFTCFERHEYSTFIKQFEQNKIEPIFVKDLEKWFNVVASCKLFLCNLSATASIAYSLNQNRILEPWNDPVAMLFSHESLINSKQKMINSYYNDFEGSKSKWNLINDEHFNPGIIV